jgi:hypothetical protein
MPLPTKWTPIRSEEGWTVWLGMTSYLYDEWQKYCGIGDTGFRVDQIWTRDVDGVPVSPDRPDAIRHEVWRFGSSEYSPIARPSQWPDSGHKQKA